MEKTRLTLVREKGKDIPPLVVEAALLNYGAAVSVAYAHADDGVPAIEIFQQSLKDVDHAGGALGFINEILEMTKDHKIVLHLSSEEKDLQPYTILVDEKKNPSLVAFLIGDFSENKETDGHTAEYTEATEYLTPKLQEFFEKADDDIPKLMKKLKEPHITRELNKMGAGDFLNCTILASNGDILGFCRPTSPPIKHDWGSASGEYEAKAEPESEKKKEPEAAPKALTLAERLAAKKAAKASDTPAETPAEPKKEEEPLPPGQHRITEPAKGKPMESLADRLKAKKAAKEGASGDGKSESLHVVGIPPKFDKAKNRRKWFSQRGPTGEVGVDFPDFQTRTDPILVPISKLQACHANMGVVELTKRFPVATPEELKKYSGTQAVVKKDPVVSAAVPAPAPTAQEIPGIIPAAQKQHLKEKFLSKPKIIALVDKKGQSVMDPSFLPSMEDKAPLWSESLGMPNIHAADWWKVDDFMAMGSFSLNALSKATFDYKMLWLKEEKKVMELEAQIAKLKGEPLPGSTTGVGGTETKAKTLAERLAERKANAKVA